MSIGTRRIAAAALALLMLGMTPVYAAEAGEIQKDKQIIYVGGSEGSLETDGVEVSKTISPTGTENYFDITLTAKTQMTYTGSDAEAAHVVIVLDLSNTMLDEFTDDPEGKTRYEAAIEAVEAFVDGFVDETDPDSNADRMIGVAAFNTDGHKIVDMTRAITSTEGERIKKQVEGETKDIVTQTDGEDEEGNPIGYGSLHSRFTNMEAGLKVAKEMLEGSRKEGSDGKKIKTKNEIVIFITDGFPTTYLRNTNTVKDYSGYDPYCTGGTEGNDGVFYDAYATKQLSNTVYCKYGTSYSDKAAIRAKEMAVNMKADGMKIYSVGIDITGQKIADYENDNYDETTDDEGNKKGNIYSEFSTIDTKTTDKTYEIQRDGLDEWLKGSDSTGIGSNSYTSADNASKLIEALTDMISGTNDGTFGIGATAKVTTDPVTSGTADYIEFLGFYDKKNQIQNALTGSSVKWGTDGAENDAKIVNSNEIKWDLEKSAYAENVAYNEGGSANSWTTKTVTHTYTLKYRIRLETEAMNFVDSQQYNTNGTTTLTYEKNTQNDDGTITTTLDNTINYPIPQVKGYLGSLSFTKVDSYTGQPLSGAEFTLAHGKNCSVCEGKVEINDATDTSNGNGKVEFTGIPSGHTYTLSEKTAAPLHHGLNESYAVTVAYGQVTVAVAEKGEKVEDTTTHFSKDDNDNITITNDTVLPGDVTVTLTKTVDGSTPGNWLNGKFTFTLTDNKTGKVEKTTNQSGGQAEFVLNYKGASEAKYTYTLREVKGSGRYYYDSTVYTVVVNLEDKQDGSGDYTATVTYHKGEVGEDGTLGEQVASATFNNITRSTHTHTEEEVPPVPEEIPKSGGMSALGLAAGLAAVAAVVSRKRRK